MLDETSLAVVGKWPHAAAQSLLGSVGTSHHIGIVLLALPAASGTHYGWVCAKHPGRHHCHGQHFLRLPASHTSSNIDMVPAGCRSWHLMYSFRCSHFHSKESMRDQRKCRIYPMWGTAWHVSNQSGRNYRVAEFPLALSLHHPVRRMKAKLLVSKWILLLALQHFKYLSC